MNINYLLYNTSIHYFYRYNNSTFVKYEQFFFLYYVCVKFLCKNANKDHISSYFFLMSQLLCIAVEICWISAFLSFINSGDFKFSTLHFFLRGIKVAENDFPCSCLKDLFFFSWTIFSCIGILVWSSEYKFYQQIHIYSPRLFKNALNFNINTQVSVVYLKREPWIRNSLNSGMLFLSR